MADTYWEQPGNGGAIPLPQVPNFILSHGHFTCPPCFVVPSLPVKGVSGADTGRRLECSPWNTVSGAPQAPFLRTNLGHGMGQKSECEVGLTVSFLVTSCHMLFQQHSSK